MKHLICASFVLISATAMAGNNFLGGVMQSKMTPMQSACQPDIKKLCSGVPATKLMACLKSQTPSSLTAACVKQLTAAPSASSLTKGLTGSGK